MSVAAFVRNRDNPWDPLGVFSAFVDPFETLGLLDRPPARSIARDASAAASTRVDWVEKPDAHIINVDLPGLSKDQIKVEVEDGNILRIGGERSRDQVNEADRWHHVERSFGQFLRRFRLPDNVRTDKMEASFDNGVLKIRIPKEEEKKPEGRQIPVEWRDADQPRIETAPGGEPASQKGQGAATTQGQGTAPASTPAPDVQMAG